VGALGESVNSGIGATGAMHSHWLGTNLPDGLFEMVLNAVGIALTLPAGKRRAIVRDD
jgi:predicted acyltransferase